MSEYIRVGRKYNVDEIVPWLGKHILLWCNKPVKMKSLRYKVFEGRNKRTCVCCGLKIKYAVLEQNKYTETDKFHFNFYGIKDGKEIMMTKDHKIPISKGGSNSLKNLQPMCIKCNNKKSNNMKFSKGGEYKWQK